MQISIAESSLLTFSVELEKAFEQGYKLSYNQGHLPVQYGYSYFATLVKEDTVENATPQRGRPKTKE